MAAALVFFSDHMVPITPFSLKMIQSNYSEWCTPYVYLRSFVLGDEIKVHGS